MSHVTKRSAEDLPSEIIANINSRSLFASSQFLSLWQTMGGTPVYWCAEQNNIVTVLPGVEYGSGLLARFQSLPEGLYSRVFSFSNNTLCELPHDAVNDILAGIVKRNYCKVWIYDFDAVYPDTTIFSKTTHETDVIDISHSDWQPPDATLQSEIRKAERENIQIASFDVQKHFDSFVTLMEQTEERHGRTAKYPISFFKTLAELAARDNRIVWKHCMHEGKAAASHIFFIEGSLALHWQVYFDKQFSWLKPNQYILFHTSKELQKRGVKTLSLGASPEDAEGLRAYKEKWGGKPHTYYSLSRKSWIGKLL